MNPTFEQAIEVIRQLPPPEREKVRDWIDEENKKNRNGRIDKEKLKRDEEKFQLALQWVDKHRQEFDGKWVVLDGDQLISHGTNAREVYNEARSKGIQTPFLKRVKTEILPWGGW